MRGIATVFVVLFHVTSNKFVSSWLGTFQLYIFFFVSGCLFRNQSADRYIRSKIHHIIIPYFVWGMITLAYYWLIERSFRSLGLTIKDCLEGLLLGIQSKLDFNTPLWLVGCFILTSVIYYCLYHLLARYLRESIVYTVMFGLFVVFYIVFDICGITWGVYSAFRVPGFLLVYLFGNVFIRYCSNRVNCSRTALSVLIGVCLLVLSGLIHFYYHVIIVTVITGVIGTLILAMGIRRLVILEYVGRASFLIMCIHGPIYRVLVFVLGKIIYKSTETIRGNIIISVMVSILSILTCLVIDKVIDICMTKMHKKLNANRPILR